MSLKCKLGFHNWKFDCEKCSRCGKERQNNHEWSINCNYCFRCSKVRNEQHNWKELENNYWKCNNCRCISYGVIDKEIVGYITIVEPFKVLSYEQQKVLFDKENKLTFRKFFYNIKSFFQALLPYIILYLFGGLVGVIFVLIVDLIKGQPINNLSYGFEGGLMIMAMILGTDLGNLLATLFKYFFYILAVICFLSIIGSIVFIFIFLFADNIIWWKPLVAFIIGLTSLLIGSLSMTLIQQACPNCGNYFTKFGSHEERNSGHADGLKVSYRTCKACGHQWGAYY
jgi:hypothetical protein